jgi:succinyl-diaminopimelate desuccinylase
MTPTDRVLAAIDACQTDMVEFTRELVAIPTENPPGNEYERCAAVILDRLTRLGIEARMVGPCVIASVGAGAPVLRFHGHYDVVPRSVDDQFNPRIEGANLFGRGSSDMKSGLAAMIYAAHALRTMDLDGRVELVIVPDEETGGERGTAWLSGTGHFDSGGVGMLMAEPTSGVVWNANRGAISLRVTVKGKPAHVGLSRQGINAFERMLVIARALEELKVEIEQRETAFSITPHAARRSILMMGGECRGGTNFNLVPESCAFTVDRRLNPEEDLQTEMDRLTDVFDRLRRQGIDHTVETLQVGRASGVPQEHPLAASLARAITTVTGTPPKFEMCPGLLECRFYAERGIPALAYGPGLLSVSHGPNEFVPIRNIRDCAASYALAATDCLMKASVAGRTMIS